MKKEHILVIGAGGQIGTVLTEALRRHYSPAQVWASDLKPLPAQDGPVLVLDVLNADALQEIIVRHRITQVYHLAAVLSATGEKNPMMAWNINMTGLLNVLEAARNHGLHKVYYPSSIAVFGREAAHVNTPQQEVLIPETVYGISKVAGENWANYYFRRYGTDVRSLRYPGIIGYESLPGGGTTDYAVDIYHHAVRGEQFRCFLKENTALPMLYMPDAVRATIELMEAPAAQISVRTSYNLSGMSFTPAQVAESIRKMVPGFEIVYSPDFRQQIADSWPASIDDNTARNDWGWRPQYDLDAMTADMLDGLKRTFYRS